MIQKHSDDPDVAAAAAQAAEIVRQVIDRLPKAEVFDYGGHELHIGEYGVCDRCTGPIAEAQQASDALLKRAEQADDTVKEHIELAAALLHTEAAAAAMRAELHNGHGSEQILNELLGFIYRRNIHDSYDHSHNRGNTHASSR
jgi:hypothetical protein